MAEWHTVARDAEIAEGASIRVEVDGEPVAIFRVDGTLYAIGNRCPHAFGPLDQGYVEDCRVSCPWHGWSFPLAIEGAPRDGLPRYRVRVEGGAVAIEVPAAGC